MADTTKNDAVGGPSGCFPQFPELWAGLFAEPVPSVVSGREDGGRHLYFEHPGGMVGNLHLGHPKLEVRPERVIPRLKAMLGADRRFEIVWISVYTFRCRRLAR